MNELKPEVTLIQGENVSDPLIIAIVICLVLVALYVGLWFGGYIYSRGFHKAKREFIASIIPLQDGKDEENNGQK